MLWQLEFRHSGGTTTIDVTSILKLLNLLTQVLMDATVDKVTLFRLKP